MYIDVHCHLNHKQFKDDLDEVIQRARAAGVKKIITAGVNDLANRECIKLAEKYDIVECSVGAYPFDALNLQLYDPDEVGLSRHDKFDIDKEIEFWKKNKNKFIAIGEIGMDFSVKGYEEKQKENFRKLIDVAIELDKPIVVHTRKAERECVDILLNSDFPPRKVVLHCFGGRKSIIKDAVKAGMNFSIPPVITRLQHFETLVKLVPIDQLLTETDSPWLSPVKDERNEPANVVFSIEKIAQIKGFTKEETMKTIFMNFQRIFL
ncbi:TatD family hydrolase [Nanoarchaeota archaeon]